MEDVRIVGPDHDFAAAYVRPSDRATPGPAVIVLHEILGLNDDIRRIASRFAAEGYATLAPDLFDGAGPSPLCILRTLADYRRGSGRAFGVLDAAHRWLSAREEVDAVRIGVAGFCMGGGFALLLGARADVGVVATYYGDVPPEGALRGICPTLGAYGGRDLLFARKAEVLRKRLRVLGVEHDVTVYDDAGHSFMSRHDGLTGLVGPIGPLRAAYHPKSAEDSWSRMLRFFATHLDRPAAAGAAG